MIKRFMLFILAIVMISGCTWMGQLTDGPLDRLGVYTAGRSSYYAITPILSAGVIAQLENRFDMLLAETSGVVIVEPDQSLTFLNDMLLIASAEYSDPYGLLGDLVYSLQMFGASFEGEGTDVKLTSIQPVPRTFYKAFSDGWIQSKRFPGKG